MNDRNIGSLCASVCNVLAHYYHGPVIDELLCRVTETNTVYYHHDGLGSTVALTDSTGNVVESYTYDVYGQPSILSTTYQLLPTSSVTNRFLFTGREYLAEIALYDYRHRIYSPSLGRFLQTDPLRFDAEDVNLYRFVKNNLSNWIDSDGREAKEGDACSPCEKCEFEFFIADNRSDTTRIRAKIVFVAGYPKGNCVFLKARWWTCTWGLQEGGSEGAGWREQRIIDDPFPTDINVQVEAQIEYLSCEKDDNSGSGKWVKKISTKPLGGLFWRRNTDTQWNFSLGNSRGRST